ncbi:MAG TPA: DUF4410 domain-containing protein [Verrucomicrobiae bacterium]|nr:DUF4410 domain-containing protein [Verrucomicrobiae bacterium]
MKPSPLLSLCSVITSVMAAVALAGCASSGGSSSAASPNKFKADDGRTIDIGKATPAPGGTHYRNPHMEKCWVADGFTFNGYDTLYISPTLSTAKYQKDEERPHELARENLPKEFVSMLTPKGIFPGLVTKEADLKPGARTLKLENTIVEYSKGGGAARFWVGMYGGGQPVLRVQGKMTDGDKVVFTFEARRSGVSGGARIGGAYMKDEDIQIEDIRSLVLDLTDFMAAIAGKYAAKN